VVFFRISLWDEISLRHRFSERIIQVLIETFTLFDSEEFVLEHRLSREILLEESDLEATYLCIDVTVLASSSLLSEDQPDCETR